MKKYVIYVGMVAVMAMFTLTVWSAPLKPRYSVPTGWSKLKLSDEQKEKLTVIKTGTTEKVKALQAQIAELKEKAQEESLAILNDRQREQLLDTLQAKAGLKQSGGTGKKKEPQSKED
jgi:hypothetical protein